MNLLFVMFASIAITKSFENIIFTNLFNEIVSIHKSYKIL